ncbi:MAG TPA: fructosamine kinase family protein [Tepidisphaeraceae bacterium]|jgi:fructosamine-3-kinase
MVVRGGNRMQGGDDISWAELCRIAGQWAGGSAGLREIVPLQGGSTSNTLLFKMADGKRAVCKVTPHRVDRTVLGEAHQLSVLEAFGVPVPQVYAAQLASLDQPNSFLLMEFMDGVTLAQARRQATPAAFAALQAELAGIVARLHDQTARGYGKLDGPSAVCDAPHWPAFFRALGEAAVDGACRHAAIPIKTRKKIEKLHDRLDHFVCHDDRPRLLHGDLWNSNVLCRQEPGGDWHVAALIDPSLRFGHAEYELAYMELFDTVTRDFRRTYYARHAADDGYQKIRKPIYQLYPLMHHVNAFGQRYIAPLLKVAEQATAVV